MKLTEQVLVRALGAADALHLPIRNWHASMHTSANRDAGLALLRTHGVPVRMGGSQTERKNGELALTELAGEGLITVTRYGRVKFPYVRLSPTGEAHARELAALPDRAAGRVFLERAAAASKKYVETISGRWCPEVDLNGGKGWGEKATEEERKALIALELEFLPAASLGWVRAHSSYLGHVAYLPTPAGLAELTDPSALVPVGALPVPTEESVNAYHDAREARLRELNESKPERVGDVGSVPLIASALVMKAR